MKDEHIEGILLISDSCAGHLNQIKECFEGTQPDPFHLQIFCYSFASYAYFHIFAHLYNWEEEDLEFLLDQAGILFGEAYSPSMSKLGNTEKRKFRDLVRTEIRCNWQVIVDVFGGKGISLNALLEPKKIDAQLLSYFENNEEDIGVYLKLKKKEFKRFGLQFMVFFKECYFSAGQLIANIQEAN